MPPASLKTSSAAAQAESAQVRAQLQLREWILSGALPGGERIAELAIVERLGVSRTPIRAALMRLEQEGLLEALPGGGYAVRSFSERDITDAIEMRGTLEGLLARLAAERGAPEHLLDQACACLAGIDTLLVPPALDEVAFSGYVDLNRRFHDLLTAMAQSPAIAAQLERVSGLPFASASGFVVSRAHTHRARDMFVVGQDQHRQVLDAIRHREGTRAENIMREHSRLARRNLHEVLNGQALEHGPAGDAHVRLIRRA
ncbi:MAG: hypothetical protein RJA09_2782 [Pseudomonadota bacterium]|jgi:GntR family transcriptional regulator of vanillate catabolism